MNQVDECGRRREITMAVVDVWLQLLFELHTDDGMQLLKKHANDSMNVERDCAQGIPFLLKTDGQSSRQPGTRTSYQSSDIITS